MQNGGHTPFFQSLSEALAHALSAATSKSWTSEVSSPDAAPSDGTSLLLCLALSGGLQGESYLQLSRADVLRLGSKILDQPASIFGDEHAEALIQTVRSSEEPLNVALGSRSLWINLQVRQIKDLPSEAMMLGQLRFRSNSEEEASFIVYFSRELDLSLGSKMEPQTFAGSQAEKERSLNDRSKNDMQQERDRVASSLDSSDLDRVIDVPLNVTLRFGQRQLLLREVLELSTGALVELDRRVEEPVDLMLDGHVIARGEVVIVDGNYGMRVTEVLKSSGRTA